MAAENVETVYRRYFPLIREKCRAVLGNNDEAQDVAQETFIRLWRSGLDLQEPRTVIAWTYKTSTRLAVNCLHARRSETTATETQDEPHSPSSEDVVVARRLLTRIARNLSKDELEIAVLSRIDGLNQIEVARVLEVSERTVRRLLDRLDSNLRRFAAEERIE